MIASSTLTHTQETAQNSGSLFFMVYPELAEFLGGSDAASIVQRVHFWLQNPNAGYQMRDGRKWILNGYKEWGKQFTWLSLKQIGNLFRHLESIGWLKSERFHTLKRSIGFIGRTPDFQEDNQRKWYRLDYEKILADTGFDLLFNQETDNSTVEPKRRKRAQRANVPNRDIAISQNETLQYPDLGQSSIHRKPNKTTHSKEASEKFGILTVEEKASEILGIVKEAQEKISEEPVILEVDQCSAAAPPLIEKIVKHQEPGSGGMSVSGDRPPRQSPKMKYPAGPWLTENGCLNEDFIKDQVNMWRTGDTLKSKAFGAMPIEDVAASVCIYYQKPENHSKLETRWDAYVRKSKRYIANVRDRLDGEIEIPLAEKMQIIAKAPAVMNEPVEPTYEPAANTAPVADLLNHPALPEAEIEVLVPPAPPVDEEFGCQNVQTYTNTVRDEDRDFWTNFTPSAKPQVTALTSSFVVEDVVSVLDCPRLKGKSATVSMITEAGIWVRVKGAIAPFGPFQPHQLRKC